MGMANNINRGGRGISIKVIILIGSFGVQKPLRQNGWAVTIYWQQRTPEEAKMKTRKPNGRLPFTANWRKLPANT